MYYTTVLDVRLTLRGDTTETGTAADLTEAQIATEIENAQDQVDSTLRTNYVVPFSQPVPKLIANITRDIAAYLCDLNYRKSREYESDNYPIIRRWDRARELLEWLRTGVISLDSALVETPDITSEVIHMYEPRLMTEEDVFVSGADW